jgi:glutathione S-transferase
MKLRYSPTSPYTRKVNVVAIETGQDKKIQRVVTDVSNPASDISKDNPLGKIPALITDDGQALYDSPVICEYLDSLHGGPKLFPKPGPRRWAALRRQALADGIMDAAILRMVEGRRPAPQQSEEWKTRQWRKVERALDALEGEAEGLAGPVDIGHVAVGCALEYVDFRFPDADWRRSRPKLAAWQKEFAARPAMKATVPKEMKA